MYPVGEGANRVLAGNLGRFSFLWDDWAAGLELFDAYLLD